MAKIILLILVCFSVTVITAQNYISGPHAVYGLQYNSATAIALGGSILVGNGGNWFFAGKVSSVDKVNPNAPSSNGRSEIITFSGTGTYSGAALVDGYVATTGQTAAFTLPIGNRNTAYPLTVPAGATVIAAYFDGLGSNQSATVNGVATTEYSPFIDLPAGIIAGSYIFSYPAGFSNGANSSILSSGNTSASGTTSSTTYKLLANVPKFKSTASTTSANLPASVATQAYFGSLSAVLPVSILSFTALANGCAANLAWYTASESNSSFYSVEAGLDGNVFTEVGKVASKNSLSGADYNYAYDKLGKSTTTYFRLKAVDFDGGFTYSQIVAVSGTGACSAYVLVKVSPNPTSNIINISGLLNGSHIALVNMSGQKLIEITGNGTSQAISLTNYANGIYILQIQNTDGSANSIKVIKK